MQPGLSVIVSGTSATACSGTFAVGIIADAVISAVTGTLSDFSGVTLPAGQIIFCNLSSITLASGTVILYKTGTI